MKNLQKINNSGKGDSKHSSDFYTKKREFTPEEFRAYNERMWNEIAAMTEEYNEMKAGKNYCAEDESIKVYIDRAMDETLDDDFELY